LKNSDYAMPTISDKKNANWLRKIYEPLYSRRLSDEEIEEIETNLKSFAEVILRIAGQIKSKPSPK